MWSVWCRALVGTLLVALGASLQLYDLPANDDLMYQDDNDIDTGPPRVAPLKVNDVMMRKLLRAQQMQRLADNRLSNRLHILPLDEVQYRMEHRQEPELGKGGVFKRLVEVFGGHALAHRPQQKWKIKKGKSLGSQMVCYFKLCAFRSPA